MKHVKYVALLGTFSKNVCRENSCQYLLRDRVFFKRKQ
jgi:hypothetical protein